VPLNEKLRPARTCAYIHLKLFSRGRANTEIFMNDLRRAANETNADAVFKLRSPAIDDELKP